ncbi:MAG: sigma-70 family RNA polymerase sigma factor [Proteobacteria bacterium]|nr:sigma-70 family RNA polymerase sigma factor [Pseudomonadota bacterium]
MSPDEIALWHECKQQQSRSAREQLFSRYLPVARRIAWRLRRDYASAPIDARDIDQLAHVGLLEAIDQYRPELGVPFRYYSTRRITGAILDGIARSSDASQQIATRRRIERERVRSLSQKASGGDLAGMLSQIGDIVAELALGLMLDDAAQSQREPIEPGRSSYETAAWRQALNHLLETLATLPEAEQSVIRLHYLEGVAFEEIAKLRGLSKGRISQIHKGAISLLRKRLSVIGHFSLTG